MLIQKKSSPIKVFCCQNRIYFRIFYIFISHPSIFFRQGVDVRGQTHKFKFSTITLQMNLPLGLKKKRTPLVITNTHMFHSNITHFYAITIKFT